MAETRPRRRRWRIALGLVAVLGGVAAAGFHFLLTPERVTGFLQRQAHGLGLDLSLAGRAHYRFLPQIQAVLPALRLSAQGSSAPMFDAASARVRLPWGSLWSGPLEIEELVIVKPTLDLDRLRAWLAQRPRADGAGADLRLQLRIEDARLVADGKTLADGVDATLASEGDLSAWLARWSRASTPAQLAPPVSGTLDARSLEFGSTRIEGLHVELRDEPAPARR